MHASLVLGRVPGVEIGVDYSWIATGPTPSVVHPGDELGDALVDLAATGPGAPSCSTAR